MFFLFFAIPHKTISADVGTTDVLVSKISKGLVRRHAKVLSGQKLLQKSCLTK